MRPLPALLTIALSLMPTTPMALGQDPPRPRPRPAAEAPPAPAPNAAEDRVYQTACPALIDGRIAGRMLRPIREGQCGERSPLLVSGILVNGRMIELSAEATLTCAMASTLPDWASRVDAFAQTVENSRIATLIVGTSYQCRDRRTGTESRDLSEHGLANGLDVTGFALADGRLVTVEAGWGVEEKGESLLRFAHDAACTAFMTVLGPEANSAHRDHLHLDQGCHGRACLTRICQ